ncbi:MAG: hypothetical protein IH855_07695 [Bacteroidetes bacterium]|nr:hypothetical protein [Bacteroidota bacterium]
MLLHDGPLAVGAYELSLDTAVLSPGVYIIRASVRSGTTERAFVRRLTIIR